MNSDPVFETVLVRTILFTGCEPGIAVYRTQNAAENWLVGGPMEIKRSGSQTSRYGSADYFTGTVKIDPLIETPEPGRVMSVKVTFDAGARTAWHTHPLGQT